jgi:elongation factor 1-alpha
LLVVSAGSDEFEADISMIDQIREEALLMYTFGVKQIIILVNKMDATDSPFSERRFNEIKNVLSKYIKDIGYQLEIIAFIPVSATHGDNMIEPSENMSWYKGWTVQSKEDNVTGKTLVEAIDAIILMPQPSDKPLRIPIEDVYNIGGNLTVPVGRVESGVLKTNMKITFAPSNITTEVKSIQIYHESVSGKVYFG